MQRSMKQSERYLKMKAAGIIDSEIEATFKKKIEMQVFSYNGDIDTILSPLDHGRIDLLPIQQDMKCLVFRKTGHLKGDFKPALQGGVLG